MALATSSCQHIAPQPMMAPALQRSLEERPLGVAPVRAYADALAAQSPDPGAAFDSEDGLSLREGLAVALWYNPDLRITRIEMDQAAAIAKATGRWPDPEISGSRGRQRITETEERSITLPKPAWSGIETDGMGNVTRMPRIEGIEEKTFSWDADKITRSWINMGSLSITVPISGRLGAEKRYRRSEHRVRELRVAESEILVLQRVRDAWYQWSSAAERAKLLDDHLQSLVRLSETAESLAAVGELPASRARLFVIERLRKEADRDRERARETELHASLLHLLGLLPDSPVQLVPQMNSKENPLPDANIDDHPAVQRALAEYEATEFRLKFELRKQYPDLTFSPTYTKEKYETAFVLGLGFPLPIWNANRQGIAEAVGAREIARAKVENEFLRVKSEHAQALAALDGARTQRTRLYDAVVPVTDRQLSEVMALANAGEIDFVLLYETLVQILETKLELLNATLAESIAASRLSAIEGTDIPVIDAFAEKEE
ncbi:MAG: TolC family protein [Candidatus Hydrogenedentes bacterium]|nr:TolC family protein [Candidatus Hydrogenedentota bacterium]